jgi:hypothetical protein
VPAPYKNSTDADLVDAQGLPRHRRTITRTIVTPFTFLVAVLAGWLDERARQRQDVARMHRNARSISPNFALDPPHPELRRTRERSRLPLSPRNLGLNFGERQGAAAPDKPLGRDLLLRVDFGELHGTVALSEPMGDAAATKDAGGK